MNIKSVVILFAGILFSTCTFSKKNKPDIFFERQDYVFRYNLNKPDKSWHLPSGLAEISGLSYIGKGRIACNQDEKGNIYIFNIKKDKLEKTIKFNDAGDYEAIETVGDDAWVIKSNGNLYRVKNYLKKPKTHTYKTAFNENNNIEGLAYDPMKHRLLIACKGYPFIGKKHKKKAEKHKAIYEFNLRTNKLNEKPLFLISLDSIRHYKNYNTVTRIGVKISSSFDSAEGDVSFKPSGIAIHPVTGNIYILASAGKSLAIFNPQGEMLALVRLNPKIHKQPEGICFSPKGTLYISNENKEGKGLIMEFYQK
jgi:uncharacterized protein YjiK